jgi:hypothetical protein
MKEEIIRTYLELKEQFGLNASRSFSAKKNEHLVNALISLTSFLEESAQLSNRVYCLIHNISEKPACSCGVEIKAWSWGDGYRKQCPSCAMKNPERIKKIQQTCMERFGTTTNLQTEEVTAKRMATCKSEEFSKNIKERWATMSEHTRKGILEKTKKTNLDRYGAENQFSKGSSLFEKVQKNSKESIFEKYGVDNIAKVPEFFEKGKQTRIALGYERHPDQKADVEKYYLKVWEFSNKAFKEHYYDFTKNETIKRGSEYHLDHIYSVHQGFIDNIPPYIIGHKNNLRLLSASENSRKNKRCDITIEEILNN